MSPAIGSLLSNGEMLQWGAVGALLALAITQVLPAAISLAGGGQGPKITPWRAFGAIVVVLIFAAGGGVAALLIGDVTAAKQAVAYGLAWQSILGGAIKTGRAALPNA
jgi:hypothetical protein